MISIVFSAQPTAATMTKKNGESRQTLRRREANPALHLGRRRQRIAARHQTSVRGDPSAGSGAVACVDAALTPLRSW